MKKVILAALLLLSLTSFREEKVEKSTVLLHQHTVCPPTPTTTVEEFTSQMNQLVAAMSAGGFYTNVYWIFQLPVHGQPGEPTPSPSCAVIFFDIPDVI